jgi:hypothetical protein
LFAGVCGVYVENAENAAPKKGFRFFLPFPSPRIYAPNLRTYFRITKLYAVFHIIALLLIISGFCYCSIMHYSRGFGPLCSTEKGIAGAMPFSVEHLTSS